MADLMAFNNSLPAGYEKSNVADHPKVRTCAISQQGNTSLGLSLRNSVASHADESGFKFLTTGSESFSMRLALIQAAEKTLDLQYYSIHDDTTSNLLLEALVQAVRRGVRIRFLLDDINFMEVSETFCMLNGFNNIDVRVFNPFTTARQDFITKWISMITSLDIINRRMHNKALIVDNQMAIIGGRNLGDEYFEEHTDVAFRDIDILTAGPITAEISQSFDQYWNSENAIPLSELHKQEINKEKIEGIRRSLREHWEKISKTEKGKNLLSNTLSERLKDGDINLTWAKANLVADSPKKIYTDRGKAISPPITELYSLLEKSDEEFIAVSPYFVPRKDGVEWLAGLVKRGIRVKVLTNSLGSTDVIAVHTGYRRYRKALVDSGVELYELKPIDGKRPRQRLIGKKAPARASLHAKIYAVDRRVVMIGSFNLDPRSFELNTELALVIHSLELGTQVGKIFDEVTSPDTSYRLASSSKENYNSDTNGLVWKAKEKGLSVAFNYEPHSGLWRNIETSLMGLLPIEDQL